MSTVSKSSFTLSPIFQRVAAFLLVFMFGFIFSDLALPYAARLHAQGHQQFEMYFKMLAGLMWFVALLVLLPRRNNTSRFAMIRTLGRLPLLVRYFLVVGIGLTLFGLGVICERLFT